MSDYIYYPPILFVFGLALGALSGALIATQYIQRDAVRNGVAEFTVNSEGSVKWKWKPVATPIANETRIEDNEARP